MLIDEVKVFIMTGLSLLLLSATISFGIYLMTLRDDFAQINNSNLQTQLVIEQDNRYKTFNGVEVTGVDVISAIRDFSDEVSIGVKDKNNTVTYYVDKSEIVKNPLIIDYEELNTKFIDNKNYEARLLKDDTYYNQMDKLGLDSNGKLTITTSTGTIEADKQKDKGNEVTAIIFFEK